MVYYPVEIRDVRNISPLQNLGLHREYECPMFSWGNYNSISDSVPSWRIERLSLIPWGLSQLGRDLGLTVVSHEVSLATVVGFLLPVKITWVFEVCPHACAFTPETGWGFYLVHCTPRSALHLPVQLALSPPGRQHLQTELSLPCKNPNSWWGKKTNMEMIALDYFSVCIG